ncbi:hypothetical protein ZWY2020_048874 [Hordeum vulgare]|nr:hypothetical protein ZWY2020_048874 [Hordeum vulgare]
MGRNEGLWYTGPSTSPFQLFANPSSPTAADTESGGCTRSLWIDLRHNLAATAKSLLAVAPSMATSMSLLAVVSNRAIAVRPLHASAASGEAAAATIDRPVERRPVKIILPKKKP